MNNIATSPNDNEGAKSLTALAYERLRADIVRCRLRPNEKLRISVLCERYGANSSAIREALSRLVSQGLVQAQSQRGFSVSPVSKRDLLDLTRTRIQLECLALTQSIELGGVAWESQVLAAFHQLSRTPDPRSDMSEADLEIWSQRHGEFHRALISGCDSHWLLYLNGVLSDQSERYRNLSGRLGQNKPRDLTKEHRELMDAVLARDATAACRQIEHHLSETTRILLEIGKESADEIFGDGKSSTSAVNQATR